MHIYVRKKTSRNLKEVNYLYVGGEILTGFQLRYIYLIDKKAKLTVPSIPFSKIEELGAKMYRGKKG